MWSAFSSDTSATIRWPWAAGRRSVWPAREFLAAIGARLDALAYSGPSARDGRVDLLRGLAVVVMVVDHLAGPSPLHAITGGNHFFTSAAEAFVFLSGLIAGVVSQRAVESHGIAAACRRLLTRAWTLWALAVGLGLVVVPLASTIGLPDGGQPVPVDATLVWGIATLQQTGYLVDVPVLYALLLAIAPLALVLLHEGRAWCVLLMSLVLWAGYQLFPDRTNVPWPIAGNELFHFAAWQLLFFVGLTLGFNRDAVAHAFPRTWRRPVLAVVIVVLVALVVACVRLDTALRAIQAVPDVSAASQSTTALRIEELLFSKSDLRPGRLLATAATLGGLYLLATEFWVPVRRTLGWLLLPLGQNALYAYSAHVILALVATVLIAMSGAKSPLSNAAIQVVSVASIWLGIRLRFLYPAATSSVRIWLPFVVLFAAACLFQFAPLKLGAGQPQTATANMSALPTGSNALAKAFGTPVTILGGYRNARSADASAPSDAPHPTAMPTRRHVAVGDATDRQAAGSAAFAHAIGQIIAGTFREDVLDSVVLGRQNSYYVYLPPEYGRSTRRYPVLYLLHGGGGSKDEWPAYGAITTLDRLITSGAIQPMILVLPQGDKGYWIDAADSGPRWGEYISHELLVNVDTRYRTQPDGDHRAIGGLSMGGAGALQLAFNHPDLFHTVGAHSPSLHVDDGTFPLFGTGSDFDAREPLRLAVLAPNIDALTIWIDAGADDPWLPRDRQLHQSLIDRGIVHTWNVLPGGHEGPYWQRNIERYLRFYAGAFAAADSHS